MTKLDPENVLEDKDPQYDAMLSQMVGRIRMKPGGKPEMGDVSYHSYTTHHFIHHINQL